MQRRDAMEYHPPACRRGPEVARILRAESCQSLRPSASRFGRRREHRLQQRDGLGSGGARSVASDRSKHLQARLFRIHVSFAINAREVLGDALKHIRFPLMSIDEFSSGLARSSLASDK